MAFKSHFSTLSRSSPVSLLGSTPVLQSGTNRHISRGLNRLICVSSSAFGATADDEEHGPGQDRPNFPRIGKVASLLRNRRKGIKPPSQVLKRLLNVVVNHVRATFTGSLSCRRESRSCASPGHFVGLSQISLLFCSTPSDRGCVTCLRYRMGQDNNMTQFPR